MTFLQLNDDTANDKFLNSDRIKFLIWLTPNTRTQRTVLNRVTQLIVVLHFPGKKGWVVSLLVVTTAHPPFLKLQTVDGAPFHGPWEDITEIFYIMNFQSNGLVLQYLRYHVMY